jgi:hypothetical protein
MAHYYVFIDRQYGPYELSNLYDLLAQHRFNKECWVFHKGETSDWTRAGEIVSLQPLFEQSLRNKVEKASESLKISKQKPALDTETLLVSPSKVQALHPIENQLPSAPLSDLPSQSKSISQGAAPVRSGLFESIKRILRLS